MLERQQRKGKQRDREREFRQYCAATASFPFTVWFNSSSRLQNVTAHTRALLSEQIITSPKTKLWGRVVDVSSCITSLSRWICGFLIAHRAARCGSSSLQWLPRSKVNPTNKNGHSAGHNIQAFRKTPRFRDCLRGIVSQPYPNSVESSLNPHTRLGLRIF